MFEKEAKERAKDFTDNKERQAAYECGFLDGADRMRAEMQKLEEDKCELLGIIQGKDKAIKELEERIEKMKCCSNCDFLFLNGSCYYDKECKNKDHWKLMR